MLKLKAVSNTPTHRVLICAWSSRYSDRDVPMRVTFNAENVTLQPNLDGLEWILNTDRGELIEQIRDLVDAWSD